MQRVMVSSVFFLILATICRLEVNIFGNHMRVVPVRKHQGRVESDHVSYIFYHKEFV